MKLELNKIYRTKNGKEEYKIICKNSSIIHNDIFVYRGVNRAQNEIIRFAEDGHSMDHYGDGFNLVEEVNNKRQRSH